MRAVYLVLALGVSLAGCSNSLTTLTEKLPSGKTVPEWAMSAQPQAETGADMAVTPARKRVNAARRAPDRQVASTRAVQPDTAPTNSAPAAMLPLSREYREHEEALDARLRARMNICNGC